MRRSNRKRRKLVLERQTIRVLGGELGGVQGGIKSGYCQSDTVSSVPTWNDTVDPTYDAHCQDVTLP